MRAAVAAGVVLVGSAVLWSGWVAGGALHPEAEAARDGEALLSLYTVDAWHDDVATLGKSGREVAVRGLPTDLPLGVELSVTARPGQDGVWQATWFATAPGRPAKRYLGLVGLGASALLLGLGVRRRPQGWVFRG